MKWTAEAPSNIALIKYMGKSDHDSNVPTNPSLSYTLPHLISYVEIKKSAEGQEDTWQPLIKPECDKLSLSASAQLKFINHFRKIKALYDITDSFIIRSCNNFPQATGMASSASSFAALTKCAYKAMSDITNTHMPSPIEMANISKLGSGSSCRSFFAPYAVWSSTEINSIELPYERLIHQSIVISSKPKKISSSQAHRLVQTSPKFNERINNIPMRFTELVSAFKNHDWRSMYDIVKFEFLEMHELFSTSATPFHYMESDSWQIIDHIEDIWIKNSDGPLITMDAGPNVHLLYRPEQANLSNELKDFFSKKYAVI